MFERNWYAFYLSIVKNLSSDAALRLIDGYQVDNKTVSLNKDAVLERLKTESIKSVAKKYRVSPSKIFRIKQKYDINNVQLSIFSQAQ